jgi:leucyl-tRNA synthetase
MNAQLAARAFGKKCGIVRTLCAQPCAPSPLAAMADTTAALGAPKEAPRSFARRNHLVDVEATVQARWNANKEFESDAPTDGSSNVDVPKFMVTFPYPYMNGRLHLGHAFTVSKAEFAAGYQRLLGKNVLFPFAFHCTGMPIQAAANRLKREYLDGVPDEVVAKLAAAEAGVVEEPAAPEEAPPAEAAPEDDAPAGGAGGDAPRAEKELGKFAGKKSKLVAKGASGTKMSQFEILVKSGLAPADIPAFQSPHHWLKYFPPLGEADLRGFGLHTDWRRSFITTDANPYYDSFIRWQFNTLKARNKIGFGKRPTVFSPLDGQACADHDRSSGEGVGPQEYTLIKIQLQEVPAGHKAGDAGKLEGLKALLAEGRPVYFVAATLRPETMYGQTNLFLLPEGEYNAFAMTGPAAGEGGRAVFICTERSARNMSYQGMFATAGVVEPALGEEVLLGEDLLGLPCSAPYAAFPSVYTLPLLTISMKKGTGVVTSVPSDAPDDFAALRDLKEKPKLREKFGLPDAAVMPFDPVPIIDIPGYGNLAAIAVCDQLKIKSQNDKEKLAQAKDLVYLAGFYQGTILVGKYAGKKVADAKPLVKADMVAEGFAASYFEPESIVMSRSGDECVVAEVDQWFLRYGASEWRGVVEAWIKSGRFEMYSPATAVAFDHVVAWLTEWACSRSFGLGTALPWDPQFVIESLSDSTIYMAYYTVAHMLHGGSLDGSVMGKAGIPAAAFTDAAWDYIFQDDAPAPPPSEEMPAGALDALRREFRYWYPLDLRVSGKDLINNHLTMSLYNHAAIWLDDAAPAIIAATGAPAAASGATSILSESGALPSEAGAEAVEPRKALPPALADVLARRMPQSFFCNGHVLVDGKKMSKSLGNFILLHEAIARWSADGTRFALADSGDTLEDANYERDNADNAILRLTTEEEYAQEMLDAIKAGKLRVGDKNFADK